MSIAELLNRQVLAVQHHNNWKANQAWNPYNRPAFWGNPWDSQPPPLLAAPLARNPHKGSSQGVDVPASEQPSAPSVTTLPAPPEYRPEFYQPVERTYNFKKAPEDEALPEPFKRDIERDSRRTLEAAGVGGLLGLLLGGGRGAALGAIGAGRGFGAGREQLAQEQQRQHEDNVRQVQERNARARQIWADAQAAEEIRQRQDMIKEERDRAIFEVREAQRAWDHEQQKAREEEARARAAREKADRERQEQEARKKEAADIEYDARIFDLKQEFPLIDYRLKELHELLNKGKPRPVKRNGHWVTKYDPLTRSEKRAAMAAYMELRKNKNKLLKGARVIQAQRAMSLPPAGAGR